MNMTREELLDYVRESREADANEPDTFTMAEAMEAWKCGRDKARKVRNELEDAGLICREWIRRDDGFGSVSHVRGYRFINKGEL